MTSRGGWARVAEVAAAALLAIGPAACGGGGDGAVDPAEGARRALEAARTLTTAGGPGSAPGATVDSVPPSLPGFVAPEQLATGALRGLIGHRGAGDAAIWRQPDGSLIVRLDGYAVSNVGGLSVYLVPGADQDRPQEGVRLGALATSEGSANLPIPAGTDTGGPLTVLVWSEASQLPVAAATVTPG